MTANVVCAPERVTLPAMLVVGDGELASRLERALGRAGFQVTVEGWGEEAVRVGASACSDAIIVKQAHEGGGPGFVSRVRRRFPEARVVFATAVGRVLVAQPALDGRSPDFAERMGGLVLAIRAATADSEPQ